MKHVKIFIFVVLLIRVLLAAFGPYELAGDEAHYWEWSQRPALSYYTKGPGVAWSILLSTEVFGNTVFGIKLPAILCFALLQW
ncbi:MAG: dolichyl-phosphate-mannose--protein mannosyltransferase, partial [Planctomycetota bacterium]